jgi:hypothetical protein
MYSGIKRKRGLLRVQEEAVVLCNSQAAGILFRRTKKCPLFIIQISGVCPLFSLPVDSLKNVTEAVSESILSI